MADPEEIIVLAVAFIVLFFIGGFIGSLSFSDFEGRFYLSGLVFAVFGTGAGILIIRIKNH